MSNEKIKTGDVVWCSTGGPAMTVGGQVRVGVWVCQWFDGKKMLHGQFHAEMLTKEKPEELPVKPSAK